MWHSEVVLGFGAWGLQHFAQDTWYVITYMETERSLTPEFAGCVIFISCIVEGLGHVLNQTDFDMVCVLTSVNQWQAERLFT